MEDIHAASMPLCQASGTLLFELECLIVHN